MSKCACLTGRGLAPHRCENWAWLRDFGIRCEIQLARNDHQGA